MKYSKEIYQKALKALDALRKTLPEEQRPTLDFVAEAIGEKAKRDLMPAADAITELSGKVGQLKSENQKLRKLAENGKSAIDTNQRLAQRIVELVSKTDKLEKLLADAICGKTGVFCPKCGDGLCLAAGKNGLQIGCFGCGEYVPVKEMFEVYREQAEAALKEREKE